MKYIISILFSILSFSSFAQIANIRRELSATFFEFNLPMSKFDLRKKINSTENFSSFEERKQDVHDILQFSFRDHYKLSFQKNKYSGVADFWYIENTDSLYAASLDIIFNAKNSELADKQFNEFINFFKPISFKTELNPRYVGGEKIGDVFLAFSSKKAYDLGKAYLIVMNSYTLVEKKENTIQIPPPGEYYWLSFSYYPNSLN